MIETALALSAAAIVISIGTAVFLLVFDRATLDSRKLTALDADLSDLSDRVNQWMRRDSTRRAREAKAEPILPADPNLSPGSDRKAALRARARSLNGATP